MTCGNPTALHADIALSKASGVVERTIFRLVLNGRTDVHEICSLLCLFSRPVIANGIRCLVNKQILAVDMASGVFSLSEPLVALLCSTKTPIVLELPDTLVELLDNDGVLIVDGMTTDGLNPFPKSRALKSALFQYLLPGVNLDHYVGCFDFVLTKEKRGE